MTIAVAWDVKNLHYSHTQSMEEDKDLDRTLAVHAHLKSDRNLVKSA